MSLLEITLVVAAYLIGSINSAIIVCRIMGLPDPRAEGSRNPGATNVLRIGGKRAAAVVLAGDMLKGLVAVLLARTLGAGETALAAAAAAAFLGHLYPLYFGFKGGKGVATLLGVLLGLSWWAGLATCATWLVVAKVFRVSSISGLTAAVVSPAYIWWFTDSPLLAATSAVLAVLLVWRHRSNIRKLLQGTETHWKRDSD